MTPLRVVVDARLRAGEHGGVESVVAGLADAMRELDAPDLRVRFLTLAGESSWLRAQAPQAQLVEGAGTNVLDVARRKAATAARRVGRSRIPSVLALSADRAMNDVDPDVVHYPFQHAARSRAPFLYQPHDLQHRHLPQLFDPRQSRARDELYRALCRAARLVVVAARWVKTDVVDAYGIDPAKVVVIPLAPAPLVAPASDPSVLLPNRFILYPAANWPHKNHDGLLAALAVARHQHPDLRLVLTGPVHAAHPDPRQLAQRHGVDDAVQVLGYVDAATLAAIYDRATAVVVPTLFEAASFPVWEAFQRGVAVACSDVTALPEQVDGHALLFDPLDVEAMAQSLVRLWSDDALRVRLAEGGRSRVAGFTWVRTAQAYAAAYRLVGGRPLSVQDEELLAAEEL